MSQLQHPLNSSLCFYPCSHPCHLCGLFSTLQSKKLLKFVRILSPCSKPSKVHPLPPTSLHTKKIPSSYNGLMSPTCRPPLLLLQLCPLFTQLSPHWLQSHTYQGCSGLEVFSLVVLTAWNALPQNICSAISSPPSKHFILCSNVIFSTRPTLITLINTETSLPPAVPLSPLALLHFCAPQHSLIYNMLYYPMLSLYSRRVHQKLNPGQKRFLFCSQCVPRKIFQFIIVMI